jgi:tetratricopeptide (TPR) repeat protein
VLAQDPDNSAAFLEKGQCEYALGSIDSAARDFQEFIRREPNSPEGEYLLGLLDLTASRTPSAIQRFQRAVQIDPRLADGYYYLAEALYKSNRNAEAKSALSQCLQIDPTSSKALALLPKLGRN